LAIPDEPQASPVRRVRLAERLIVGPPLTSKVKHLSQIGTKE
jgi:hypothetical protein